jgi:amino acid adenylation domain-containing protein/non-ribosomal peptide synthase protein (TIGR01720 family)
MEQVQIPNPLLDVEDFYPLSPAQAGLLFHAVASPEAAVYFQQMSCVVAGPLDAEAWRTAVDRVLGAHPVLRTGFVWEGVEQPVQVVRRAARLPLDVQDWRGIPGPEQRQRLEAYLRADRRSGFDMRVPPLMRMALIRIADDAQYLVWSHHHLVLDGWSMQLLYQQIAEQYVACRAGRELPVPSGRPYRDYVAWLLRQDQEVARAFWRAELAGVRRPTPIGGRPASTLPEGDDTAHGDAWVELDAADQQRLQQFARQQKVTVSTILQGAWALLLSAHAGHETVIFGATVSGRPVDLDGVEDMVGLFVNVQPVRVHVDAGRTVEAWLRQLQLRTAEARMFEHASMTSIQGWSEVERGLPLFESLVTIKNYPVRDGGADDDGAPRFEDVQNYERTSFPLCLVGDVGAGVELQITYNPLRFGREAIDGLRAHLRALIRALTTDAGRTVGEVAQDARGGRPLSPAQRQLVRSFEHGAGMPTRVVVAAEVQRDCDRGTVEAALVRTVERHEILRTALRSSPGMSALLQVVLPEAPPRVDACSPRDGEGPAVDTALDALVEAHLRGDAGGAAVDGLWLSLAPRGTGRTAVVLSAPGAMLDVPSAHILLRQLLAEPAADAAAAEPAMQYGAFADWHNAYVVSAEARAARRAWKTLALPEPGRLPLERTPGGGAFDFGIVSHALTAAELCALEEVNGRADTSVPVFLLACWAHLLCRLAGQDEAAVGVVFDGRIHPDLQGAMGLFERMLPVVCSVAPDQPFLSAVRRTEEAAGEAFRTQACFVADDIERDRNADGSFLPWVFHCLDESAAGSGDPVRVHAERTVSERYTLKLVCSWRGDGLHLDLCHDRARVDDRLAGLLLRRFHAVVARAVAAPLADAAALGISSEADRALVTDAFNRTTHPWPAPHTLDGLLLERPAAAAEAVALRMGERTLGYAALDARANRLARHLRSLGVGPEVPVAVCIERSFDLVAGLLAVVKAGGAYVPLDPHHPPARLRYIVRDAGAAVVLTDATTAAVFEAADAPAGEPAPARAARPLRIDAPDPEWAAQDAAPLAPLARPENLAYVIYTSGTTGQPKGVGIPHRAVANQLRWLLEDCPLGAGDRVLQRTSPAFDASVWEIFAPLLAGAELVLASPEPMPTADELIAAIRQAGVTVMQVTPTLLELLLDAPALAECVALRRVCCGGEALGGPLSARLGETLPSTELVNLYGPTETTVQVASWHRAPGAGPEPGSVVPIGRPVANTQLYVLDDEGAPAPVGVAGELFVGGAQVGRGYLGRASLTAERFVPDAIGAQAGGRLYRTGDAARWRADGALEYLGRLDQQIKLRGFRIEPGEIEAVLREHPAVAHAAVAVRLTAHGGPRLVAYVVLAEGASASADDLRDWLRERLPEAMVPTAYAWLEVLPLTPNGKLDRAALPDPEPARAGRTGGGAPRNETEATLLGIWREVLRDPELTVTDNFFEMGGDSILTLQVVARSRQAGLRITPRDIFEHPTVEQLAAIAVPLAEAEDTEEEPTGAIPLVPIQADFFERAYLEPNHYNQAEFLEPLQPLDPDLLRGALARVVAQHDSLRLRFRRDGVGWRQFVAPREDAKVFRVVEVPGGSGLRESIEAAAAEIQTTLNIENGPLIRAALIRAPETSRLLIVAHHLAVDTVSWSVILADLEQAYAQMERGEDVVLEPPAASYGRWARQLAAFAASEDVVRSEAYWLSEGRRSVGVLPVDHDRGPNTVASMRTVARSVDAATTEALFTEAMTAYRTRPHEVVLAALGHALSAWSGHGSVLVDVEGHGREEIPAALDVSRTCGWFTLLVPTLLECEPGADAGTALKTTKEQLRAIPHRGLSYGTLRHGADAQRRARLAELPQAEVSFNYFGEVGGGEEAAGPWRQAPEDRGPLRHSDALRNHLIDVTGLVVDGTLCVEWSYTPNRHEHASIERLADLFLEQLTAFAEHCAAPEAGGLTPSDFPHARLSQEALDALLPQLR